MIKTILNWFKPRVVQKFTLVEIDKSSPLEESLSSVSEVQSLRSHSGFQWLVKKLRLQSARLQGELNSRHHADLREVIHLQSGIFWCNWLNSQVDFARERYLNMRPATLQETLHLQDISPMIDLIGGESVTNPL